jgi:MTH538 TIR-like domain (DUF1863).
VKEGTGVARYVYFAFDYKDVFKVNQVRKAGEFVGVSRAGFVDASQWEQLKKKDEATIKKAIDEALVGTTVTVVCVGERTHSRQYVNYEIRASHDRDNGLLGVYLPGENEHAKPKLLDEYEAPLYSWDPDRFAAWVETAARAAGE